jgi:hypothetical protein
LLNYDSKGDPTQIDLARLYLTAVVATDDAEEAYLLTQHLDADWYHNPTVTTNVHSRSTAVGDVLALHDSTLLIVASYGFTPIPNASLPAEQSLLVRKLQAVRAKLSTAVMHPADLSSLATDLQRLTSQVALLYTALNFALPILAHMAGCVDHESHEAHYQALLARFGREQAEWALADANRSQRSSPLAVQASESNELTLENDPRRQTG